MRRLVLLLTMMAGGFSAFSQSYNERVQAYVSQYKDWAIAEQQRSGIPAAITLAQGVLETAAGNSELATQANNHFGIKCKKEWTGETFAHTDDAPNECFRKYSKAYDSYKDHSDYLRSGTRYQPCFAQSVTDYAAWATQLRKCGYATNPKYAQQLIKIIEDFKLQEYTYAAMEKLGSGAVQLAGEVVPVNEVAPIPAKVAAVPAKTRVVEVAYAEEATEPVASQSAPIVESPVVADDPIQYGKVVSKNGMKGFYAHKGDVLLEHAIAHNMRYARLLELNDLPDAPLEADMFVYLEKKTARGKRSKHVVKPGETALQVAQEEGMQLRQLRLLNQMENNEEPVAGTSLQLQQYAAVKPPVGRTTTKAANAGGPRIEAAPETAYIRKDEISVTDPVTRVAASNAAAPIVRNAAVKQNDEVATVAPAYSKPVPVVDANSNNDNDDNEDVPATKPVATTRPAAQPAPQPAPRPAQPVAPKSTAFNIANERTVDEQRRMPAAKNEAPVKEDPAPVAVAETPAAPMSDFDKLKSKLDQMVYSQPAAAAPRATATPAPLAAKVESAVAQVNEVAANGAATWHTVQNGDTAFGIARKYGIGTQKLMQLNNLDNFQTLKAGQKLRVK